MNIKPFCVLPWMHVTSYTNGHSAPCCTWKGPTSKLRALEYFTSEELGDLRDRMLRHDPPDGCADCIEALSLGNPNNQRQQGWHTYFEDFGYREFDLTPRLQYLEINFSNICNLKCRMCDNLRSSKWASDAEAMGFGVVGKLVNDVYLSDDTIRDLRKIQMLGGEPLLHQEQIIDILSRAERLGTIGETAIGITTNGTISPSAQLTLLLRQCRWVSWTISIDAFGELNEYIRSDSDWQEITDNLSAFHEMSNGSDRMSLSIGTVCMLHNANRMHELSDFIDSMYPSITCNHHWYPLHFPEYLANDRLPPDYLRELADMYESFIHDPLRNNEHRIALWWLPLARHLRQAADRTPYSHDLHDRNTSHNRALDNSRYLITKLDGLRGDSIAVVNPDIWHQLQRNA